MDGKTISTIISLAIAALALILNWRSASRTELKNLKEQIAGLQNELTWFKNDNKRLLDENHSLLLALARLRGDLPRRLP